MATISKVIGTGGDYPTLTAWHSFIPSNMGGDTYEAKLKGETFSLSAAWSFNDHTNGRIVLRKDASAAHHNGVAAAVSGATNIPIISGTISLFTPSSSVGNSWLELYDIEVIYSGTGFGIVPTVSGSGKPSIVVGRCLFHPASVSTTVNQTMIGDNGLAYNTITIYRSIFYGFGAYAINLTTGPSAAGSVIYNNTICGCGGGNPGAGRGSIRVAIASGTLAIKNNAVFDPQGTTVCYSLSGGTITTSKNVSSDTSSPDGATYRSKASADNLVSPSSPINFTTFNGLGSTTALFIPDAGDNLGSPYDVDIQNQMVSDGLWDIGADEFVATASGPCATTSNFFEIQKVSDGIGGATYGPRSTSNPRNTYTDADESAWLVTPGAWLRIHAYFDISSIPQGIRITSLTVNFTTVASTDGYFLLKNLPYAIGSSDSTLYENASGSSISGNTTVQVATGAFVLTCNQTGMDKLTQAVNNSTGYFAIQMLVEQNPGGPLFGYDINDQVCLDIQYEEVPVVEGTAMLGSPKKRTRLNAMRAVTT